MISDGDFIKVDLCMLDGRDFCFRADPHADVFASIEQEISVPNGKAVRVLHGSNQIAEGTFEMNNVEDDAVLSLIFDRKMIHVKVTTANHLAYGYHDIGEHTSYTIAVPVGATLDEFVSIFNEFISEKRSCDPAFKTEHLTTVEEYDSENEGT